MPLTDRFRSIRPLLSYPAKLAVSAVFFGQSDIVIVRLIARFATTLAGLFIALAPLGSFACSGRAHIEIKASGVYALDYDAIVHAQPALRGCRADDIYLLNRDKEVPIRVVSNGNGEFREGDRIEWLATALHGPQSWFDQYSSVNVYQLGVKSGAHKRVKEIEAVAAPAKSVALQRTLHIEQENLMLRVSDEEMKPGEEPDVWQWAKLTPIDPKPFAHTFDLPDFDANASKRATSSFTFDLRGMSNVRKKEGEEKAVDHVVEISINDKLLQRLTWDGRSDWRKTIDVANSALKERGNLLTIRVIKRDLPGGTFIVDVVMFNWFEANYPIRATPHDYAAAFSSTDDGAAAIAPRDAAAVDVFGADGTYQSLPPQRAATLIRGVDYFASAAKSGFAPTLVRAIADDDERAATSGYDYMIVAHPRLLEAIKPLAQYHRDRGLNVALYNVDDVYDQFNGGIVHPSAIRDLVAWGLQHWATKPRYLLLVGDASFDIHHDLRTNRPDKHLYSPSVEPGNDMMLQDGFFALPSTSYAGNADALPNRNLIPTWQFPTGEGQSASDNGFVATRPGDFHPQLAVGRLPVVLPSEVKAIVDKTISYVSKPTTGDWHRDVTFVSTSEVASFKQTSDAVAKDLQSRGFAVNSVYSDFNEKDAKQYQGIRDVLRRDLDQGNLLVHFIGHGGQYIWRVGPIGDLFTLDDVSALKNVGRYPMVLAMTCFSAPFDHPTEDSIGERFLREPDRGAVAVFAASWKNWPNAENSRALVEELLRPGVSIGDAIVNVKSKTSDRVLVEMYNLLGDPALVLAQPQGKLALQLSGDRWNSNVAVRIPAASFGGDVDVDWLDAQGDVMEARHYQARDTLFSLAVPKNATQVQVFVSDTRTGFSAMGAANVLPPAPVKPAIVKAAPVVVRPPRARNPKDDISDLGFDNAPHAAPPADNVH